MANHVLNGVVGRMSAMLATADVADRSDADLVRGFIGRRDRAAFEAIVRRHGPMVLGVCRRLLRNAADADDAFQATFIVLLRKAQTLRRPERLAGWLYQVAYRVARKARQRVQVRGAQQIPLIDLAVADPVPRILWDELRPIFDDELNRLPDKLRLPVLLCFLEGLSKREAARRLAWPEGTVSSRLQIAREKLRLRLSARGLAMSVGMFHLALFQGTAPAAVPATLLDTTFQSTTQTTAATAGAAALAEGMVQSMLVTKLKLVAVGVLAVGLFGGGTGWVFSERGATNVAYAQSGTPGTTPTEQKPQAQKRTVADEFLLDILKANDKVSDTEFIRRVYLDVLGRLPTAAEVRDFMASADTGKREKLVDKLAKDMSYNQWAMRFLDIQDPNLAKRIDSYEKSYRAQAHASAVLEMMNLVQPDRALVERIWMDFLGLPPTPQEVEEFQRVAKRIQQFEKLMREAEIDNKRAEVEAARAQLKELEAQLARQQEKLKERVRQDLYMRAIAQAHVEYERQLLDQAEQLKKLESDIEQWRDRVAYIDRMVLKGYATRSQADADKSRLAALLLERQTLLRQRDVRRVQDLVREREAALQKEEEALTRGTGSEAARDRVLATLAEAKIELARTRIREELETLIALRQREVERIAKAVEQKLLPAGDLEKARKALDEAKKRLADAEK